MARSRNPERSVEAEEPTVNSLALSPVASLTTAETVERHLERLILAGVLRPGEKLPPERILSEELGVSRNVLRSALKSLSERELLRSTQGGGNYISDRIGSRVSDPLAALFSQHPKALDDFMEFRAEFEGSACYLAAARATGPDIAALQMIFDRMEAAHLAGDMRVESVLDTDFHMAIAEMSHNTVFIHISHSLGVIMQQELLNIRLMLFDDGNGANGSADQQVVLEQHRAILNAIRAKDSRKATAAMRDHLSFVQIKLREIQNAPERVDIARQRLSRWASRIPPPPR
ncbi:MAG: FadR/GntR family transcriptional regulator [Rhizobiaceae bacterium]